MAGVVTSDLSTQEVILMRGIPFSQLIRTAAAISAIMALSCGGGEETTSSPAATSSSTDATPEASVTPSNEPNVIVDDTLEVPADFPEDIPLYPDAEVGGVLDNPSAGQHVVAVVSRDSVDQIADYYGDALENRDWDIEENLALGDQSVITARKGDRIVYVLIATNGVETVATIKAVGLSD